MLVTAKTAEQLFAIKPRFLRSIRMQYLGPDVRLTGRVRANPVGVRVWRYMAQDIPIALSEIGVQMRRAG